MKKYDFLDLQAFISVVEAGSFNKAAERLDTSTAAISRRVSSLEAALGVCLLQRTTRQLHLTDAGQQYYVDAQNILAAAQEAEERLSQEHAVLRGKLSVAAPLSFGVKRIAPLLPAFMQQHPDIHIDVKLEDRETDLYAEGVDVALRIGRLQDSSLIATRLCSIEFVVCASPDYLARQGEPMTPDELRDHQCLHYSLISLRQEWPMVNDNTPLRSAFSANNGEVLQEAALQGNGIVMLPRFIVESALEQGLLQAILTAYTPTPTHLYALRLSRQYTPMRVLRFIEYLQTTLK